VNSAVLYLKYVIILGDIHTDASPNQNTGGCVPGIPGGVDASATFEAVDAYQ